MVAGLVTPHEAWVGGQENWMPYYDSRRPHGFAEDRLTGIGYDRVIAEKPAAAMIQEDNI